MLIILNEHDYVSVSPTSVLRYENTLPFYYLVSVNH